MKEPQWLLRETVLALQERLLAEFGGLRGLRDAWLLDSALARPHHGLIRNHPFLDGNKRIGFTAAVTFLELNGCHFTALEGDAVLKTLALAARELDEADYAAWLREHSRKASRARS